MDNIIAIMSGTTLLLTGLCTGLMVGHWLLLGRYLDWFLKTGHEDWFRGSYPEFLRTNGIVKVFDNLFTLSLLVSTVYLVLRVIQSMETGFLLFIGVGLQWLFVLIFIESGFAWVEKELFRNDNFNPGIVEGFKKKNLPFLSLFSSLWLVSFIICIIIIK